MGYVVVVFCMLNGIAFLVAAYYIVGIGNDLIEIVRTAVQDEIRKQDDRIEKRLAKAVAPAANGEGTERAGTDGVRAGQPLRR